MTERQASAENPLLKAFSRMIYCRLYCQRSSVVEQWFRKPSVGGSTPLAGSCLWRVGHLDEFPRFTRLSMTVELPRFRILSAGAQAGQVPIA